MTTNRLIIAGIAAAALLGSAPALADGWHRRGHGYYAPAPRYLIVQQRHYAPPPRVVFHQRPVVVYRPAPVYYAQPAFGATVSGDAALGVLVGAALGTFIGHGIATGF